MKKDRTSVSQANLGGNWIELQKFNKVKLMIKTGFSRLFHTSSIPEVRNDFFRGVQVNEFGPRALGVSGGVFWDGKINQF